MIHELRIDPVIFTSHRFCRILLCFNGVFFGGGGWTLPSFNYRYSSSVHDKSILSWVNQNYSALEGVAYSVCMIKLCTENTKATGKYIIIYRKIGYKNKMFRSCREENKQIHVTSKHKIFQTIKTKAHQKKKTNIHALDFFI